MQSRPRRIRYWKLRSYLPADHPLKSLELGQEPTPAEYIANQVKVARLVRDCLAPHGTYWINVGDTYSGSGRGGGGGSLNDGDVGKKVTRENSMRQGAPGIEAGNLCLIPQRLTIALQDDGWLVRSIVIWHKPACMPASITGWLWKRCRVKVKAGWDKDTHPQTVGANGGRGEGRTSGGVATGKKVGVAEWSDCPGCKKCDATGGYVLRRGSWRPTSSYEPVIMLAKSASYFCDGEAVKTPPAASTVERDRYTRILDDEDEQFAVDHDHETTCDTGANLRDVWLHDLESMTREELLALFLESPDLPDRWVIPFEPLREKHYAAYPTRLVDLCLRAGTSERGYCKACGAPFVRVVDHTNAVIERTDWGSRAVPRTAASGTQVEPAVTRTIDWRASCKCENPEPRRGVVLDPFAGSGRTAIAAGRLDLDFVGCELNEKYAAMGRKLVKRDMPLLNTVEAS